MALSQWTPERTAQPAKSAAEIPEGTPLTRVGEWAVSVDQIETRIFPFSVRAGKKLPVKRYKYFLILRHPSQAVPLAFTRYLHQKRWYWGDTRKKGSVTGSHVVNEVARILYGGDANAAKRLVHSALRAIE